MPTPVFDRIAINFLNLVPDQFQSDFTPGAAMPDGEILTKEKIADYVNKGMMKLFNDKWSEAFKLSQGVPSVQRSIFASNFPELLQPSQEVSLPYIIGSEALYRDFFRLFGAVRSSDNLFIRIWDEDKLTQVMSGALIQYRATEDSPIIIPQNKILQIFPTDLDDHILRLQYIKLPVNPTSGESLSQNGDVDSPFYEMWNESIAVNAYQIWLMDSQQTT